MGKFEKIFMMSGLVVMGIWALFLVFIIGYVIREASRLEYRKPIEFYDEKFPVLTKETHLGGSFTYVLRGYKNTDEVYYLVRHLFCTDANGNVNKFDLVNGSSATPKGPFNHRLTLHIPKPENPEALENFEDSSCYLVETGTINVSKILKTPPKTEFSENFIVRK